MCRAFATRSFCSCFWSTSSSMMPHSLRDIRLGTMLFVMRFECRRTYQASSLDIPPRIGIPEAAFRPLTMYWNPICSKAALRSDCVEQALHLACDIYSTALLVANGISTLAEILGHGLEHVRRGRAGPPRLREAAPREA